MKRFTLLTLLGYATVVSLAGCGSPPPSLTEHEEHVHDHEGHEHEGHGPHDHKHEEGKEHKHD